MALGTRSTKATRSDVMTPLELRASRTLASIYGLRMLGLFLILPVFSVYARTLPDGHDRFMVGLALGIYGLTQAALQIPFGVASDRFGRKPVMVIGLAIFAAGSFVAGFSYTLPMIILGRAIQGAGAISAAISAMIADATREQNRTKAMAFVGMMIGLSFIIALVVGPVLYRSISVPGMFILTGVLAIAAILVVEYIVPDVEMAKPPAEPGVADGVRIMTAPLMRLNFSIFVLNFMQVALFLALPLALVDDAGIAIQRNWLVYLPVTILSFMVAVPGIIWAEKYGYMRPAFVGAVALLTLSMLALGLGHIDIVVLIAALFVFFVGFNLLEALLPSLVSRTAPPARKGRALGVYNTAQSLGIFTGGAVGGVAANLDGTSGVFFACVAIGLIWLSVAVFVRPPLRQVAGDT